MIFKHCTIGGVDYAHNSTTSAVGGGSPGRAVIPVNPLLNEQLVSMDIQQLAERKDATFKMKPQVLFPSAQVKVVLFVIEAPSKCFLS